jgi:hypothetical protein
MNVKESFLSLGHFQLNNGGNILFWEDKWLGNSTTHMFNDWVVRIGNQF